MANYRTESDFKDVIMGAMPDGLIDIAIEFIRNRMNPSDVFPDKDLENWAEENDYVKKVEAD